MVMCPISTHSSRLDHSTGANGHLSPERKISLVISDPTEDNHLVSTWTGCWVIKPEGREALSRCKTY